MPQLATATAVAENQARKKAKRSSSSSSIRNSTDLPHQHAFGTLDFGGGGSLQEPTQTKLRVMSVGCSLIWVSCTKAAVTLR